MHFFSICHREAERTLKWELQVISGRGYFEYVNRVLRKCPLNKRCHIQMNFVNHAIICEN